MTQKHDQEKKPESLALGKMVLSVAAFLLVFVFYQVQQSLTSINETQTAMRIDLAKIGKTVEWFQSDNVEIKRRINSLEEKK